MYPKRFFIFFIVLVNFVFISSLAVAHPLDGTWQRRFMSDDEVVIDLNSGEFKGYGKIFTIEKIEKHSSIYGQAWKLELVNKDSGTREDNIFELFDNVLLRVDDAWCYIKEGYVLPDLKPAEH